MNQLFRIISLLFCTSTLMYACQPEYVRVTGMALIPEKISLVVGEIDTIMAVISPADANNQNVIWSSDDISVATVVDGVVTAVSEGVAIIVAKTEDGGFSSYCKVTVESDIIHVEGVEIVPDKLTLTYGSSQQLTAEVYPSDAGNKTIIWSSSDESVVAVSQDGRASAINAGKAEICAMTADGGLSTVISVVVYPKVESVTISPSELTLCPGESSQLRYCITPVGAVYDSVEWSSENSNIVWVDNNGCITAKQSGITTITFEVKSADSVISASCILNVKQAVTGISMSQTMQMFIGEQSTISATVFPENATDKSLSWSSSNTSVAEVSSQGVVTAKSRGIAEITAASVEGTVSATCVVTVEYPTITLDCTDMTLLTGDSYQLIPALPSVLSESTLIWTTSDTSVAVVSSSGKVTAKSTGSAVITVQTADGFVKSSCMVAVTNDIHSFVKASYNGGSIMMNNNLILYGSSLNFTITNNSNQTIKVLSVYLADGSDNSKTSELTINKTIMAKQSASWSISVPVVGIHKPTAVFTYSTNNGNKYTVSAAYHDFNFGF